MRSITLRYSRARLFLASVMTAACLCADVFALTSSSATVADDPFADGARTDGADPLDMTWFSNEVGAGSPTTLSVAADGALTGNALVADNPTVPANTFVQRAVVGLFNGSPQTLGAVGDTLTLSLDFRFANALSASGENRFRFGLYNAMGTPSGGDVTNITSDDKRYWAQTGYGSVGGNTGFLNESGDGSSRLTEGGDLAQLGAEGSATINDTAKHTGILTITRTGANELTLRMLVLNVSGGAMIDVTRVDASPVTYTFDEVVLAMCSNELDYHVDNVDVTAGAGAPLPSIALESRRELFLDNYLIGFMSGASLELQTPQVAEMSLNFMDNPWEGSWSGQGPTIIKDGNLYRMYYFCPLTTARAGPGTNGSTCYAESRDGISWTRPNLGQVQFGGSGNNNILLLPDPHSHLFRPFIDTRAGVPASQKYKAVFGGDIYPGTDGKLWTHGLYILVSADALHWNMYSPNPFAPAMRFTGLDATDYDGMNTMFWSESEQLYVAYYRSWLFTATPPSPDDSWNGWYRWVKRTTSPDLVTWSTPVLMDTSGLPVEHWYMHVTSPYFRAPHIYVAMPPHYVPGSYPGFVDDTDGVSDGHSARAESRFASSRGGNRYDRLFPNQRWITTGLPTTGFLFQPGQDTWPVFSGRLSLNPVPTGPNQMSIYLEQPGRLVRYTLRTDGFVALNAAGNGTAITKPVTFSGNTLDVNFLANAGGSLKVELQDASGQPIPGFTLAQATPMTGDHVSQTVSWGANSNVGSLAGQTVKVRFELQNAKVFSFQFFTGQQQVSLDFSLTNGGNKSVAQGQSVTNTLTSTLVSGMAQGASFSVSRLPSGVTAAFAPASRSPTCTTTLTLTASASAATGNAAVTVRG